MFIDRMINQGNIPLVERMVHFTARRHELLAENVANLSTPGYVQKDLDLPAFQQMLRERVAQRRASGPGRTRFDDITAHPLDPGTMRFHDGATRSVEQLMADMSSNALRHNLYLELLRKQYGSFDNVLRERIA